ncbi:MAG: hypothetical protein E7493_12130 [Ruminococcus albus]|nr:hypothetical protein [Ruminococcus albus]
MVRQGHRSSRGHEKSIQIKNKIIPLTHCTKQPCDGATIADGILSPAAGGGKIWGAQLSFCLQHFQLVC